MGIRTPVYLFAREALYPTKLIRLGINILYHVGIEIAKEKTKLSKKEGHFNALLFGGGEEIRTLAPAKPTYRISNPDPSTTWVHLHLLKIGRPIYNLFIHFSGKLLAFC